MEQNKLRKGDQTLIAEGLHCSPKAVQKVLEGERGVRETPLQVKIKQAASFLTAQRLDFAHFCNTLVSESNTPKPVKQ